MSAIAILQQLSEASADSWMFPDQRHSSIRTWRVAYFAVRDCGVTSQDSGTDRLAHDASQLPRLARRNWRFSGRIAETYASRQYLNHDESTAAHSWKRNAKPTRPLCNACCFKTTKWQKAVSWTASALRFPSLSDYFRPHSEIQIPRNLMIALAAGAI